MSHFLATSNPEAAARIEGAVGDIAELVEQDAPVAIEPSAPLPVSMEGMPDVGDWVIYQPRRGMIRRGRNRVAALVVHRHSDTRLLDLAIFYEANDTLDDQRVPEAIGEERGWFVKADAPHVPAVPRMTVTHTSGEMEGVRKDIADLRALVLGGFEVPASSVCDCLYLLDERVDKLERAAAKPKRKRGRPAKSPKPEPKAE